MRRAAPLLGGLVFLLAVACEAAPPGPLLDLPARPADAPGGDQIVAEIAALDVEAREERIYAEVARGNVPGWLRELERVEVEVDTGTLAFWATSDYLAVGSDDDYFYVPLSPRTARRVADLAGASLPTPRMVDAIWLAARVRLIPVRFRPDEHMASVRTFKRHNAVVQAQRHQRGARPGELVAGHKLDVVRTMRAGEGAGEGFALYGWHLSDGTPIQPVHAIDPETAPHFSMGVRLVR